MNTARTLLLAVLLASISAFSAPLTAAEREKKEARLVEILKSGLDQKAPSPKLEAAEREMRELLMALADIDPKNPKPGDRQRVMAVQAEILARRDPALGRRLEQELKRFQCRAKQGEARANLKGLASAQRFWKEDHGGYTADLQRLDTVLEWKRYTPSVVKATQAGFVMRATGKDEMAGDIWEIDEKGAVKEVASACPPASAP